MAEYAEHSMKKGRAKRVTKETSDVANLKLTFLGDNEKKWLLEDKNTMVLLKEKTSDNYPMFTIRMYKKLTSIFLHGPVTLLNESYRHSVIEKRIAAARHHRSESVRNVALPFHQFFKGPISN